MKHGKGIMKFATGKDKEGYWENDIFVGEFPTVNDSKKVCFFNYFLKSSVF